MLYIDTFSYNDYDNVVRFLMRHNVPIANRNKMKMVIAAEISNELADQMQNEVDFEDMISIRETPLG